MSRRQGEWNAHRLYVERHPFAIIKAQTDRPAARERLQQRLAIVIGVARPSSWISGLRFCADTSTSCPSTSRFSGDGSATVQVGDSATRAALAAPIRHERVLGWGVHYTIGVVFAAFLLGTAEIQWASQPTLLPALLVSTITLIAPFFVMQPAMGAGIAASKTPRSNAARLRSLVTHTVYGVGLYASACAWAALVR